MLHYSLEGPDDAPVILFSNSLGTDYSMWQPQCEALHRDYRILRYDPPGHGGSPPASGPLTLQSLAQQVLALLDALAIRRVHFCGISMGGLTGLWLARYAPERLLSLTVANSAAKIGQSDGWQARAGRVRQQGMAAVAESAAERWFTPAFCERAAGTVAAMLAALNACDAESYAACCEALAHADLRAELSAIRLPLLVIAGRDDPVTTVAEAQLLAERVTDAQLLVLPASHLSSVELWLPFTRALRQFIAGQRTAHAAFSEGMTVRRAVLGDAHVNRTQQHLTPFNEEFQHFITRYAWGEIWTRPGLPRHSRSLITLAMLIALNREAELKMHLHAAFNNGVSEEEIKELLMHAALYCGLPAANAAFHLAQTVFDERAQQQEQEGGSGCR